MSSVPPVENRNSTLPIVKIVVATHRKYPMPKDDIYLPLYVGAEGKRNDAESKKNNIGDDQYSGYLKDNVGDNISILNPGFCELTGLYWAWKNLDADYIGLVHYRRHFCSKRTKDPFNGVLKYEDIKPMLGKVKIFVPKKRRYYIESLYSHYKHTHYSSHLDETRKILTERHPEYIENYDAVLNRTYGYMFNMMIMEQSALKDYCCWLFDILFELKKRIDAPELTSYQGRYYGRVSEIIFNVWLDYKIKNGYIKSGEIKEIPYVYMEKIDWRKKGTAFIKAKFFGKKYNGSF